MHRLALVILLAAAFAAAPALAAPADRDVAPALGDDGGASCRRNVPLPDLSPTQLAAWTVEAGAELTPPPAAPASPPLCPATIPCDPCGQGDGPCFERDFGSNTCCTSPTGPCFICPKGTTIFVSSCPCFGDGPSCPARDQNWYCA